MAFGTPVVAYRWPESEELNQELRKRILEAEAQSAGVLRSNVRGWHSTTDFFDSKVDCARVLKKRVESLAIELTRMVAAPTPHARTFQFKSSAWANVLRNGGYNSVHNHPNSVWSGVYYVDRGDPDPTPSENGKIELLDPRNGVNMVFIEKNVLDGRYVIEPVPGLTLLFPSWLKHMVHPYYGKGERISVAFNVSVEERSP
ncbi:MAG TPA: 2OG-Fe(II) oxygenase family protein [Casimicrobiaceae bacterium]|nr:2OG-Fe(II) oxygenase family protein [Casimicrobiaceae bacterium]